MILGKVLLTSTPGSEVNDTDSDYGVARANLLLDLAMSK